MNAKLLLLTLSAGAIMMIGCNNGCTTSTSATLKTANAQPAITSDTCMVPDWSVPD